MRGRITVQLESRVAAVVSGYGSRELVERITGRAPVWRAARNGWACQERTARSVCALAEAEGYDVLVLGPRGFVNRALDNETPVPAPAVGADAGTGHQDDGEVPLW